MKKYLIRVDSNGLIGTGHLMRCLAIAKELALKCDVVFVLADHSGIELIKKAGFSYRCLGSRWDNMEGELVEITKVIQEEKADIFFVDSYQVTERYLRSIKRNVRIAYMDDLHEFVYPCDIVINYNVYAQDCDYKKMYEGTGARLLLGCRYAPLRKEFSEVPEKEIKDKVSNILVLTGGTDIYHFALNYAQKIAMCEEWNQTAFHIVCGKYNHDVGQLHQLEKENGHIHVYEGISDMDKYMCRADIAISAGGTTLYELAACGVPTIAYSLADNQCENIAAFVQKGYLLSVGDIRTVFPKKELLEEMEYLKDPIARSRLSVKMQQLVDGKGCQRLAEEFLRQ